MAIRSAGAQGVLICLAVAATVAAAAGPERAVGAMSAAAQEWPAQWNDKLTESYEPWKPIREVLVDLAGRAGVTDVAFDSNRNDVFYVPLPAGMTLKDALQRAAAVHALEAVWEGNRVAVRPAKRIGTWLDLVGGEGKPVILGEVRGGIYLPRNRDGNRPMPWVWYAPNGLGPIHAWTAKRLFDKGVALATVNVGESQGNPKGRAIFTAFHEKLVAEHGMAKKAVLWPQSRGGLMLYNWAAEHPECVAGIGGIYTVCDLRSYPGLKTAAKAYELSEEEMAAQLAKHNPIDRLEPLAKARVPIFHVHGDKDGTVPVEKNAGEVVLRYKALGGEARLLTVPGGGHDMGKGFFQCRELAEFLVRHARAAAEAPSAATKP